MPFQDTKVEKKLEFYAELDLLHYILIFYSVLDFHKKFVNFIFESSLNVKF